MSTLRMLTIGTLLAAAAVASAAADERIETITVTARPVRATLPVVEKLAPTATVEVTAPMPTDMPEAEIDYHMSLIGEAAAPIADRVKS